MCKSAGDQRTIPAIIPRELFWEILVEEGKTGAGKTNQEMTTIILTTVNDLSQGGKSGLRKKRVKYKGP